MRAAPVGFVTVENAAAFEFPLLIVTFFHYGVLPASSGVLSGRLEDQVALVVDNEKFVLAKPDDHAFAVGVLIGLQDFALSETKMDQGLPGAEVDRLPRVVFVFHNRLYSSFRAPFGQLRH